MSPIFCSKGHESPDSSLFCQVCGEKLSLPVKSLLAPGEVLEGRYRIVQQIGQGGFGRTYLCENINRFNEPCVLKEFAPQVQGSYALDKAKTLFEREANVLHKLTHPQIPRFRELFQLNSGGGGLFLVQDYVAGPTYRYLLAQRMVQNQHFSEEEIRQFLIDTLPVLEYIHSLGVIHRDIAPDNLILRSSDNLPVLIDFGGVKQLAVNAEIQAIGGTDLPTCLGKVGYAPHEQLQRGKTYPHSDLYALAATALVLFTGKEPTEMIEPQNLIWNWRQFATLDPNFGAVLDRMLHPNITARFQTATEVLAALQVKSAGAKSMVGTVVVSPGPKQAGPVKTATISSGGLWPILRRSWLALAALAALGTGAWGISQMISSSKTATTPSPSASPMVVESSPSSSVAPTASSPSSSEKPAESNSPKQSTETSGSGNSSSDRQARTGEQRGSATNRATNSRRTPKTESGSTSETPRRTTAQTESPKTPKTPSKPKEESVSNGSGEEPTSSGGNRSTDDSSAGTRRNSLSRSRESNGSDGDSSKPSRTNRPPSDGDSDSGSSKPSRANSGDSGNSNRPSRSTNRSDDSDGSPSRSRGDSNESKPRAGGASNGSKRPESTNSKPAEEPLF
jgi:serine/threonine protein kinase